jgi:putative transposase
LYQKNLIDIHSESIASNFIAPKRKQNCYDHRLRDAVFHLGQATTVRYLDIPRSTIHGWKKARSKPVVTLVAPNSYVEELERRVHLLERRTARLVSLLRLCIVLLRLSGFSLVSRRLPKGEDKQKLLRSIDHASRFVRLPRLLQWIGISSARYYDWKNSQECGLTDASSCPKSKPGQMTSKELSDMRLMLESEDYRHLSIGSIVRLASRLGKVHACSSPRYRAIQRGSWVRS